MNFLPLFRKTGLFISFFVSQIQYTDIAYCSRFQICLLMTLTSTNLLLILKILCHFPLVLKVCHFFFFKKKVYLLVLSSRENTLKETVGALTCLCNVCVIIWLLGQVIVLGYGNGVVKEQLYV